MRKNNVAELREALAPFPSLCDWLVVNASKLGIPDMVAKLRERGDKARAALALPARNCDVYTPEVLLKEFLDEMPEEVWRGTTKRERDLIELTAKGVIDALFAPYNPEKESEAVK